MPTPVSGVPWTGGVDDMTQTVTTNNDAAESGSGGGGLDEAEVQALVDEATAALIASAPAALNTLDELAAALGDDANYAATITTALAAKLAKASNLSDLANAGTALTNLGFSAFIKTLIDDADAAAARTTLGVSNPVAQLAARLSYQPGGDYSTGSSTQADVDATNVKITFTAPASGKVLVVAECNVYNINGVMRLGLRESTTDIAGPIRVISGANMVRVRVAFAVSGISAGSHTYKLAFSSTGTSSVIDATSPSPIVMEVYDNPLG